MTSDRDAVATLTAALHALHRRGSLHVMDRGQVCVGCGGQWPCATEQVIASHAAERIEKEGTP